MNTKPTVIGMPPGIGDLHWIMTKLVSFKKKHGIKNVKVIMNLGRKENTGFHGCSLEYLDLVPFVDSAEATERTLPFEYAINGQSGKPLFINHGGCDYMIELNSSLEKGIPLKDILPEYETDFDYPIIEPPEAKLYAEKIKRKVGGKLVILFTASIAANDNWVKELWTPEDWNKLAQKIYNRINCRPVLVGAKVDVSYAGKVKKFDTEGIIHDLTGKTSVSQLFALLREANVLVAFQCGVLMMAIQFRTPAVGFWPIKNKKNPNGVLRRCFMRSWLPPWAKDYMPLGWGDEEATPEGVFDKIRRYL